MTNRDAINLLEEVKILDDTMYAYNPKYLDALDMALTALEAEETWYATHEYPPKTRWIPCSERLPAYGEDVLISIGGYCNVGYIVSVNEEEQYNWYFSGWYHLPNDVDAWMPLPEPYEEKDNERA